MPADRAPGPDRSTIARLALAAVLLSATGCSATVSGTGAAGTAATTTSKAEPERTTESEPAPESTRVPTTDSKRTVVSLPPIDESAPTQYCDTPFTGALGKPMLAAVVETPSGRLTCDQAGAILVDYYTERHDPIAGRPPLMIGPMTCNQVPEPALPQVVCADGDNLIYSMWPQT